METICDAASVSVYDDNGVLSFTRDSKKTSAATIFNRSNTKPDGYSLISGRGAINGGRRHHSGHQYWNLVPLG